MIYLQLAFIFFKTGLFTIGGGLASLPILRTYLVKGGWVTTEEFVDMIAISQSTPGPIGINMATFAGYKAAGVCGAVVATLSMVAPSLIIICLIAHSLRRFQKLSLVEHAMAGLRPAAMGMIASATWYVMKTSLAPAVGEEWSENAVLFVLFAILAVCYYTWRLHPWIYICAGGAGSLILHAVIS